MSPMTTSKTTASGAAFSYHILTALLEQYSLHFPCWVVLRSLTTKIITNFCFNKHFWHFLTLLCENLKFVWTFVGFECGICKWELLLFWNCFWPWLIKKCLVYSGTVDTAYKYASRWAYCMVSYELKVPRWSHILQGSEFLELHICSQSKTIKGKVGRI